MSHLEHVTSAKNDSEEEEIMSVSLCTREFFIQCTTFVTKKDICKIKASTTYVVTIVE